MHEERQDFLAMLGVLENALPGAGLALDDRVDRLEVTGVRGEIDAHLVAVGELAHGFVAEVILHVATAADRVRHVVLGELVEDHLQRLIEEVREHVETAAMGHAHDDFLDAALGTVAQHGVERDDERLTAFEREALVALVFRVQELLEFLGLEELAVNLPLDGRVVLCPIHAIFHAVAHPVPDLRVLDVHELRADRVAVNALQLGDHVAELHRLAVAEKFRRDGRVEVLLGEAQLLQRQHRIFRRLGRKRIELRDGVPERAICVNKSLDAGLQRSGCDAARVADGRGARNGSAIPVRLRAAEFKPFEKCSPIWGYGIGILTPKFVIVVDQRLVPTGGKRTVHR